ncbi:MAG: metallophosphoesterase [Clostridia bacterium]|nr:metallophosphoesterase [Clostridia bacterium]
MLIVFNIFASFNIYAADENTLNANTHVIINQIYGGGEKFDADDIETPVSHAFIELYNTTDETVTLDNWSLQYTSVGNNWKVLTLNGKINPHSSYLVRCRSYNPNARLQIKNYDASWNIGINNKGCKVLLKSNTSKAKYSNPYHNEENGYIDMVGVAGNEYYYLIDGCETDYSQIQSKQKAIRRIKFADTDNNAKDFAAIDYRTADIDEVGPRYSGDGEWSYSEFTRSKDINFALLNTDEVKNEFSFLHISDTQASTGSQFAEWGRLASLLESENYDFTIHTGDITDNADNTYEMDLFYENSGNIMKKPFIPVVGNHDQKSNTSARLFNEYFADVPGSEAPSPIPKGTTASFDYGNAHFIILNSESDLETQKKWLDDELSKTDKKWKIVAMHRSPYGAVGINDTVIFTPIFDKHNVDLVIHGHDHLYLRSVPLYNGKKFDGGTIYLESGSSGSKQENGIIKQTYDEVCISPKSPTYSKITVSDDAISVKAECIDDTGRLKCIDKFEIKKYTGTYDAVEESNYDIPARIFSDVRSDREYSDALTLLSSLDIIEKTPLFNPNKEINSSEFILWLNKASGIYEDSNEYENITLENAIKLVLDRLGYTQYIELSNSDYAYVAKDIGLYKKLDTDKPVFTKSDAAQLIANALEAYIIDIEDITDEYVNYRQVYTTWLDKVHKVYKIRGIIKDRPFYRSGSSNTSVEFETEYGETLNLQYSENIYPLLGYETDAYIQEPNDGGKMLCGTKTKNNNVLEIKKSWYGDVESVDKYINFSYTTDDGNKKRIKIAKDAEFVYNEAQSETVKQKALNMEHNAFKPSHIGKIKLVDCNNDNVYDFVFIDNYKDMLVSSIDTSSRKITNALKYQEGVSVKKSKYNEIPSIHLDNTDTSYRVTFSTPEEDNAAFSSITKNSVISVALSSTDDEPPESARIRRVYVSNLSACGTVTSIFEYDDDDYFVIDGKTYRASKSYYNTYNGGESVNFPDINVGDCLSLYLDFDERFAYLEKKINERQFGILLKISCDEFDDYCNLRIFNSLGETVNYKLNSKKYKKFSLDGITLPTLAEYKTNGNYIYDIDFNMDFKEYGSFACLTNCNRLGNYFFGDNTVMFLYDGKKNDENSTNPDYYYQVPSDYLKNNHIYDADIFKVEKNYQPQIIILYDNQESLYNDDKIMAVSEISMVLNKDDDIVYSIAGYSNGKKISAELSSDLKNIPKRGDIIQYAVNAKQKIKLITVLSDYNTEDFEKNTFLDDTSYSKCNVVISVNDGIITANKSGKYINYYTDNNTVVYNIDNSDRKNITIGSVNDITDEDKIFIIMKEGIANEIFVWKNE